MPIDPKTAVCIEKHFKEAHTLNHFLSTISDEVIRGDWEPQRGAVLITWNEETDTVTIVTWGEVEELLSDAAELKKADA